MAEGDVLYDSDARYIKLFGDIEKESSREIVHAMQEMEKIENRDSIDFYINSCGGDTTEILSIRDIMKSIKSKVNTIGLGKCYSGGSFLLMSGTGERKAYENTSILIHNSRVSMIYDSIKENESRWEHFQRLNEIIIDLMLEEINIESRKELKDLIKRDYYMGVEEAKELGIIDKIIK